MVSMYSTQASTVAHSIDAELLRKIQAAAANGGFGIAPQEEPSPQEELELVVAPPVLSPEEAFFVSKPAHVLGPNQIMFSKKFHEPTTVPDFPVPYYKDITYWPEQIRGRIPDTIPGYLLDETLLETVCYAMYTGGTTLLWGPTGTGKTSLLEQVASQLNIPVLRVSCHGQMEQSELLGNNAVVNENGVPVTKHLDSDTTLAARYGGMLILDEAFRAPPTALMTCQSLLEVPHKLNLQDTHGNSRQLEAPKGDFFLFLTDNTTGIGDTTGSFVAEIQDASTRNRIRRAIYVPYLNPTTEEAALSSMYPEVPRSVVYDMVLVAGLVRAAYTSNSLQETMSMRELLSWAQDIVNTRQVGLGFQLGYLSKLVPDDAKIARDIFSQVFGTRHLIN